MYADYIKPFLEALRDGGPQMQTNLTELVWGSSGRGNQTLVNVVFAGALDRKLCTMEQRGRAKMYAITDKGRTWLVDEVEVIEKINDLCNGVGAAKESYQVWAVRHKYIFVNRQRLINFHRHEGMAIERIVEYIQEDVHRVSL